MLQPFLREARWERRNERKRFKEVHLAIKIKLTGLRSVFSRVALTAFRTAGTQVRAEPRPGKKKWF
jgi:hypothetical protein